MNEKELKELYKKTFPNEDPLRPLKSEDIVKWLSAQIEIQEDEDILEIMLKAFE